MPTCSDRCFVVFFSRHHYSLCDYSYCVSSSYMVETELWIEGTNDYLGYLLFLKSIYNTPINKTSLSLVINSPPSSILLKAHFSSFLDSELYNHLFPISTTQFHLEMSILKFSESPLISFKPPTQNLKSLKKKNLFKTVLSLLPIPAPHALTAKSLQSSLLIASSASCYIPPFCSSTAVYCSFSLSFLLLNYQKVQIPLPLFRVLS